MSQVYVSTYILDEKKDISNQANSKYMPDFIFWVKKQLFVIS